MTSEEFAALCRQTGMTLEKVAEHCGKSTKEIQMYAFGTSSIPQYVIDKIKEL